MFDLLFSPIIALVKTIAGGIMESVKAKQKLKAAVVVRKLEMIADKDSYNEQWELAALQDSDRWIKRASFLLLSAPLITAIFMPTQTQGYITHTLSSLPIWYTTAYMGMLSSIWAVKSLQSFRNWKKGTGNEEGRFAQTIENSIQKNNSDKAN